MSNDLLTEAVRKFLEQVEETGRVRFELEVDVEVTGDEMNPTLRLADKRRLRKQVEKLVRLRVVGPTDSEAWLARAEWSSDNELAVRTVERIGSPTKSLKHVRRSYRVAVPPSAVASLERLEEDETLQVEPIDISRGGIGLRTGHEVSLRAGERVEVNLNILDEFAGALPGHIAFARHEEEREQTRIGVKFEPLSDSVAEALRAALNNILLGTTQAIT